MTGAPTPLDLDRLLAEQDFVRRLARSLVFDSERVDDVVQEAWLAVVQRPPRDPAAVSTWFGRVLHNLARRGARAAKRRQEREAAAARAEALPSAADVLEREEERRQVVDAVLALPEPYRGTVLARFFDDLPPREIARRRGVSAATVRSQLARGLEMVRRRLDDLHGGDRRSWCLCILPLARPARVVAAGGLGTVTGALLMTKWIVGVGVTALAVLTAWWWSGGGSDAHVPPAAVDVAVPVVKPGDTALAGATARVEPTASERQPAAAAPSSPDAVPGLAGLRGRVVFGDGRPAADQLVRVLGIDGVSLFADAGAAGDRRTLPLPRAEVRTAVDGTFAFAGLVAHARYAVHAGVDGSHRTLRLIDVTPVPDAVVDIGDFVLVAKGTIRGRAVDETGAAVAGAEVLAFDLPAPLMALLPFDRFRPDCGGMLSVPVPDGAADDLARYHDRLRDFLGRELFERADLDRTQGLATFVVDRLPWLEALWQELPIARANTGADGRFEVAGVEPGSNLLIVRRAGLASGVRPRVLVQAGSARDVGDVELGAGEELRVAVRDTDGRVLRGAEVRVATFGALGYRGVAFGEAPVVSDGEGEARVGGLPRGGAFVAVRRGADAPWSVQGPVATDDDVLVELPAPQTLRFLVLMADGTPVPQPTVELFAGPALGELRRAGVQGRLPIADRLQAGADGGCEIAGLLPGSYTLEVGASGAMPVTAMAVLPLAEPLRIVLPAARRVAAVVRDDDGTALPGAKVYLDGKDAPEPVMPTSYGLPSWDRLPRLCGTTDRAGRLDVDVPVAGATLHATHAHRAPGSTAIADDADEVAIVMPRTGELRGRLYERGVPADPRRFRVAARPLAHGEVPLPDVCTGLAADGTFRFAELAPTEYALHAEPIAAEPLTLQRLVDGMEQLVMPWLGARPSEARVRVVGGGTATLEFDVDPNRPPPGTEPARLAGRVAIDGRAPAEPGLVLERRTEQYRFAPLAAVAADGTFAVDATAAGRAVLQLCRGDDVLWEGTLELDAGEQRWLDLSWATGALVGQLTFPAGFSVSGYAVSAKVRSAGGVLTRETGSDAAGRFEFVGLPAGRVELSAYGRDGKSEPVVVDLAAGATVRANLELHEVLVLAGRIDFGDRRRSGRMLFLRGEHTMWGTSLAADGTFSFSDLEPAVYTLALQLDTGSLQLTPDRFDLSQGQSQRDVVVQIAPAAGR